jgi:hypothetical protein
VSSKRIHVVTGYVELLPLSNVVHRIQDDFIEPQTVKKKTTHKVTLLPPYCKTACGTAKQLVDVCDHNTWP